MRLHGSTMPCLSIAVTVWFLYMKKIQRAEPKTWETKHVLARLRDVYQCGQKSAPDFLGIATDTCASIESGRARLTPAIARRVSYWTGVSEKCLLNGNTSLKTKDGKPYSEDVFYRLQAERNTFVLPVREKGDETFRYYLRLCIKLGRVMLAAADAKDGKFAAWKLRDEIIKAGQKYPTFEGEYVNGVSQKQTAPEVFDRELQTMLNTDTKPKKLWSNILDRFDGELCAVENRQAHAAASKPKVKPAKPRH